MRKAPEKWKATTSGEICEYITSGSRDWKSYYSDHGPLFVRTQDINQDRLDLSEVAHVNLPEKVEGKRSRIQPGDLLVTITGANVGKVALVPEGIPEAYVSQSVGLMRLKDKQNGPFLHYFLQSDKTGRKQVLDMVYGIGRPVLSLQNLRDIPVSLPPFPEQRRIVAEIEKQFSRLEEGVGALKRVQANLKRYRAAVLKAACEGRLVPASKQWQRRKLGEITSKIGSGSTPRGGEEIYRSTGVPLIRSMNVHSTGFRFDGLVYIDDAEAKKLDHVIVTAEDVLLNITGASIGRVTTAPASLNGARVNQHVCIIRPKQELLPSFLAMFLASPNEQARVMNVQVGATRQALTKAMVTNWEVPLPSLAEQSRIVAEVERRLSMVEELEAVVAANLQRAARLRQSILQKAFAGELA